MAYKKIWRIDMLIKMKYNIVDFFLILAMHAAYVNVRKHSSAAQERRWQTYKKAFGWVSILEIDAYSSITEWYPKMYSDANKKGWRNEKGIMNFEVYKLVGPNIILVCNKNFALLRALDS